MFYRDKNSWKFFDTALKQWCDSHSRSFDAVCHKTFDYNGNMPSLPDEALPCFSGTKIICVGRNYRKHAQELGNDVPDRPLWFSKPPSTIIGPGQTVIIPEGFGRIDYEGELALVIGKKGRNLSIEDAEDYIGGVTACLDMTARELQKTDGQWTRAKGFDTFLPLSNVVMTYTREWQKGGIEVRLNGNIVQAASFEAMVFDFKTLVADISRCMTLEPGDLILTGTPEGVGPVKSGDELTVTIKGPFESSFSVNCSI